MKLRMAVVVLVAALASGSRAGQAVQNVPSARTDGFAVANKYRSDRITKQFRRIRRTILPARRIKRRRRKFGGTSLFQHKICWRGGDFIAVRSTGTPVLIWNFPYGPIRLGSASRSPGDST